LFPLALAYTGLGALLLAGAAQRRRRRIRRAAANLLITYIMLTLLLLAGEIFFRFAYAESDGLPTLALRNWQARYWRVNSLGYRDREWTPADWEGRQIVIVVGDSFTAGWGVENTADRFADVLAAQLGDGYAVINLGDPGANTVTALERLRAYPLQTPDYVIVQYTLNDIEPAALSIGLDPGLNPLAQMPAWAAESYLGSFIYWRWVNIFQPEARGTQTYTDWLHSMYDHSVVWAIHAQQINDLIDQIEAMGAVPAVVIFPDMLNPFASIAYVDRVAQVFAARGYGDRVLKLFDAAEAMPLAERIVSPRDAHASAAFHRVVGQMLYDQLFR